MCSPDHGSEWANGWNRALECARRYDTWVICQGDRQQEEIERYLDQHGPVPGLHFEFIPFRGEGAASTHITGLTWLKYNLWHRRAIKVARRLHGEHQFDLAHQLTNSGFREPGYLWKLGIPFIWGPLGGTHNYPWSFLGEAGLEHGLREALRNVVNYFQLNWSRRPRLVARRADAVLVANGTMRDQLRQAYQAECTPLLDVGIASIAPPKSDEPTEQGTLRIVWSGQLVSRKGLSLLLKAFALLPADVKVELRVVGGGPLERRWKQLAEQLQLGDRVQWLGWISHKESLEQYQWADVFAFTSLRDNSGTVLLEAMANSLPVVCVDHQGARDIVTADCGLKIRPESPRQVVRDLAAALERLARDTDLRSQMSHAARERAHDYLWSTLGEELYYVYDQVLAKNGRPAAEPSPGPHRSIPRLDSNNHVEATREPAEEAAGNEAAPVITFPRSRLRDSITWCAQRAAVGLHTALGQRKQPGFGILMYHRVADHPAGVSSPTSNVTPERLRHQLKGLLDRGFQPWPLRTLLAASECGQQIPNNAFAVTFDDGYANNLLAAVPVLQELNVPATVFVATSFLDSDRPYPFDNWDAAGLPRVPAESWRSLTTRECHELASHDLIDVGAHTHTHEAFADRVDDFRRDMDRCVEVLDREFGISRPTFAFPFGVTNRAMFDVARESGVICALTTRSACVQPGDDPFGWGRYSADDRDTVATLAAKLSGWYSPVADVLRQVKRPLAALAPGAIGEMVTLSKPAFAAHAANEDLVDEAVSAAHHVE